MDKEMLHHPLAMDDVFIPIQKVSELEDHKSYEYYNCPAWKNWSQKTFLFHMQYDIEITIDKNDQTWFTDKNPNMVLSTEGWYTGAEPVIQVANSFCMWTKSKNIIFECIPYPRTCIKNNMEVISGNFPISVWERTTSLGFRILDTSKSVQLRRGDPIYYARFHTPSFKDTVVMTKKIPPDEVITKINQHLLLKNYGKNLSWKTMLNRREQEEKLSKCPFSFLYKKS